MSLCVALTIVGWRMSGSKAKGRLRWMATLPLLSMPDALDQLKFAKENGACGIFLRPLEGTRQITDPSFFPLYDQGQKIDFCIGLHQANGSAAAVDMMVIPTAPTTFSTSTEFLMSAHYFAS